MALDAEAKKAALAAVTGVSADVSLFEYGKKVGFYQGLEHTRALLENLLRDREANDKFL